MNSDFLSSTSALSTFHCSDPETVASVLSGTRRHLLPLNGDFNFVQTELRVEGLRVILVKRPPCVSESYLDPREIGIAFPVEDSPGLRLDGVRLEKPVLMTHGLTVPHRIYQPSRLMIGAVFLSDTDGDRGWPGRTSMARLDPIAPEGLLRLRTIFVDVIRLASEDPDRLSRANVVRGVQQSLLGTIDHVYLTACGEPPTGPATGNYIRICRRVDEFILANPTIVPSSNDIAVAAEVTIRTLHNAMVAVHGMSLQKFMVLKRLWSVHMALQRARPGDLVKTIAFDCGFWHLGRFSRAYRSFFGEMPSQTLERATSTVTSSRRRGR